MAVEILKQVARKAAQGFGKTGSFVGKHPLKTLTVPGALVGTAGIGYLVDRSYYGRYGMDLGSSLENRLAEGFGIWPSVAETSGFATYLRPSNVVNTLTHSYASLARNEGAGIIKYGVGGGVGIGGAIGAAAGLFFGKGRRVSAGILAGIFGAAVGGYQGGKLALGMSKAWNDVIRSYHGMNRTMIDRTKVGGGYGYRTWMKQPGGRLHPGHLGADGSMVLASHKVRNRSIM